MTDTLNGHISFFRFIYIWFKLQKMSVPKHQRIISKWLNRMWEKPDNRQALLMAFRNSGKSTLVGLFCAWVLFNKPETRILVMAADYALAKKMVRNVKRIIEQHPLTINLKPTRLDQWAADQFTVNRPVELRDPSMLAKGLGANITGLRADLIICDDVEVPKTCDSAPKRQDLREKLNELDYILTPQGMQLYIGTPHTYYTIYQNCYDEAKKEQIPFLQNFEQLVFPLLDENGKSAWPERFSEKKIAAIRARSGENKFLSQMLLRPVNICDSRLNPERLLAYNAEIDITYANSREILKIGEQKMLSASCWWDPAFAASKGDKSVIACVFTDENGHYWLHDLEYIKVNLVDSDNVASLQCEKVIAFLERNHLSAIRIEANGIGKFLPGILKQNIRRRQLQVAVLEVYSHSNKAQRILEAFETLLAERALSVHQKIWATPFIAEMREWSPEANVYDDALDAVAGCLNSEPVRLSAFGTGNAVSRGRSNWQGSSTQFSAQTVFEL